MISVPLIVIGAVLVVAGFVGCVLPVIPGPPLSFLGLILLWWAEGWEAETFGVTTVLVLGWLTVAVTVFDFVAPAWGAKRFGASKAGIWGSVVGMIVGLVFFPPLGMFVGAFAGAIAGELAAGKETGEAARGAWGVFIGTMAGILLKLVVSGALAVYFVLELIA